MPRIIRPELIKKMRSQGRISTMEASTRAFVSGSTIRNWVYRKEVDAVFYNHVWWITITSLTKRAEGESNQ